jgi:hypothetical protein
MLKELEPIRASTVVSDEIECDECDLDISSITKL